MGNQNYGEVLCQAVDEIVRKRLEGISYDSTILCTIVDNSRKDEGVYTVSNNGTTRFDAYSSDTSYRVKDNVYVQIPGGDWNQQKIILAKKKDKAEEPFIYDSPLDSLVDITGNLIDIDTKETDLLANGEVLQAKIWEWISDIDNAPLTAYTRLGISGSFRSWLNPFYDAEGNATDVTHGNYGYRLDITTSNENTSTEAGEGSDSSSTSEYSLYLNCDDMMGNPYNFQSYYHQEKLFDISQIGKITKMALYFYQDAGTFVNDIGEPIPATDFLGGEIADNLFTIDPYISLGYDVREFSEEMVTIYTLQSTTYSRMSNETYNNKNIYLRWVHRNDRGNFESITNESELKYEIRWYRYELGHSSADSYSGVYWKNYAKQYWDEEKSEWAYEGPGTGFFKTTLNPDVTLQDEKIKAIIIYNNTPYRSNILTLTNEDEVVSKPTVDAVQALSIVCGDESYGNYRIYGQNGQLLDSSQRKIERILIPYFKSSLGGQDVEPSELIEAESIEWIIPTKATMIELDESFYQGASYQIEESTGRIHIRRTCTADTNKQLYRIKGNYSQSNSDNTIQCKIVKDKITYTAVKEFTFGAAGTTGTDYTFILDFDNGITAITAGSTGLVSVTARLYDYANQEIDISGKNISWSWKTNDGKIAIEETGKTESIYLKSTSSAVDASYNILQASMEWGDWDLIAYLPIPIRSASNYAYISGPTQVIYDSSGGGGPSFAKLPYILYDDKGKICGSDKVASWNCVNGTQQESARYTPTIQIREGQSYLQPLSFYVENSCNKICVVAKNGGGTVVWSQPILIIQNRYPSAMVNAWDGNLNVGEQDPGTILAPRLVAGKKNNDNTFSGVMLGDWKDTNSDGGLREAQTGLYGFDHGEQSYGFKEDGTAFIGKSGGGRLEFDGDKSTITSNAYAAGLGGMRLDFDDGSMRLRAPYGEYSSYSITLDASEDTTPFKIGSKFSVDWDGTLKATEGKFSGDITGSNITGKSSITGATIIGGSISVPNEDDPKFSVNSIGHLTATSATIGGWNVLPTSISKGGTVLSAASNEEDGRITSNNAHITGGTLNIGKGANESYNFTVDSKGNMIANSATIKGKVTADSGSIGGWMMYEGYDAPPHPDGTGRPIGSASADRGWRALYTYDGDNSWTVFDALRDNIVAVGIPGDSVFKEINNKNHNNALFRVTNKGDLIVGGANDPFKVDKNGNLYIGKNDTGYNFTVSNAGVVTATKGFIGGWNISSTALYSGSSIDTPTTYFGQKKQLSINGVRRDDIIFKAGGKFGINADGKVFAADLNVFSGTLGGWTLDANGLRDKQENPNAILTPSYFKLGNFSVNSYGVITTGTFQVSANGDLTAATGVLGASSSYDGWYIREGTLSTHSTPFVLDYNNMLTHGCITFSNKASDIFDNFNPIYEAGIFMGTNTAIMMLGYNSVIWMPSNESKFLFGGELRLGVSAKITLDAAGAGITDDIGVTGSDGKQITLKFVKGLYTGLKT